MGPGGVLPLSCGHSQNVGPGGGIPANESDGGKFRHEVGGGVFGQVSVFVELGGDETAVAGVAEMVDAYQGVHPVIQDVPGAAGGIFGGGLFGLFPVLPHGKREEVLDVFAGGVDCGAKW